MSQNINFIKRKRGRNHTNLSMDNCIKKAKVKIMRFIIHTSNKLIEKDNINLLPINKKYVENVTKNFNIDFLKEKIYIILSLNSHNMKILQNNNFDKKFQEIMHMTLNTCIQKLFLLKPNEFLNIYFFENEYLFENLKLNQRVYKKMKKILTTKDSLLTYFEKLNGRKIKKKDFYEEYEKLIQKIKENFENDLKYNNNYNNNSRFIISNNLNQINDEFNEFLQNFPFNQIINI